MFIEIFAAILVGSLFGIVTGITPGIHINLVAALLLVISPVLLHYFSPIILASVIISMSIVHTFLDFIPGCFLGAPDESTAMAIMPTHRLLLEGKGFEAVKLATIGSFLGLLVVLIMLPALILGVPWIFNNLKNYIGIILLAVAFYMISREKGVKGKFWALFIFGKKLTGGDCYV